MIPLGVSFVGPRGSCTFGIVFAVRLFHFEHMIKSGFFAVHPVLVSVK